MVEPLEAMPATGQDKIKEGFGDLVPHFSYATYNDLDSVKALVTNETAARLCWSWFKASQGSFQPKLTSSKTWQPIAKKRESCSSWTRFKQGWGGLANSLAFEHYGILPDIVSLAKGLANGVACRELLGRSQLGSAFSYGSHGSALGELPCIQLCQPGYLERYCFETVQENSQFLLEELKEALADKESVLAIRGLGYMIGIETTADLPDLVAKPVPRA